MVELSNEKKKKIEALQSEEMAYEINLGRRSRFQREKFAYLQTCYQKRTEEEKLKNLISQNQSANKNPDISNEKHYQENRYWCCDNCSRFYDSLGSQSLL